MGNPHIIGIIALAIAACGTDPIKGEPLISGSVTGSYETGSYDIKFGLAAPYKGAFVVLLGSDAVNCSSITAPDPPGGDSAALSLTALDVGHYANVDVNLLHNLGSFTGVGSNTGSVDITASSSTSVAGTIAYSDTINSKPYSLNGMFEVIRCN